MSPQRKRNVEKPSRYYILEYWSSQDTTDVTRTLNVYIRDRGRLMLSLQLIWSGALGRPMMFNRMEVSFLMMKILQEKELIAALSTLTIDTTCSACERMLEDLGFPLWEGR